MKLAVAIIIAGLLLFLGSLVAALALYASGPERLAVLILAGLFLVIVGAVVGAYFDGGPGDRR